MSEGFAFFCWVRLAYPNLSAFYPRSAAFNLAALDMWRGKFNGDAQA